MLKNTYMYMLYAMYLYLAVHVYRSPIENRTRIFSSTSSPSFVGLVPRVSMKNSWSRVCSLWQMREPRHGNQMSHGLVLSKSRKERGKEKMELWRMQVKSVWECVPITIQAKHHPGSLFFSSTPRLSTGCLLSHLPYEGPIRGRSWQRRGHQDGS